MLFPFLSELNREILNALPWDMQRKIADFQPNLPHLSQCLWAILHVHMKKRYCVHCGNILPNWNKIYHCLCRHPHISQRYHSPLRKYKTYHRPFHVFSQPYTTLSDYHYCNAVASFYYHVKVECNQPPFAYSMRNLLRKPTLSLRLLCTRFDYNMEKVARKVLKKTINTNTCLRTFMDGFETQLSFRQGTSPILVSQAFQHTMTQNVRVWCYDFSKRPTHVEEFPPMELIDD